MFFHLVKSVGQKKKILNPHEESIFRPSDLMLQCWILYHPFYSIITNMTLLTLLILAVWRTRVNFMMSLSHHWVSLAQRESIRAWNLNVWGLIPHGDSDFLLCPTLVTRWKTYFSIMTIVCQTVRRITNKPWKCLLVLGYKGLCVHTNTKRRSPLKCRATSHFTINY